MSREFVQLAELLPFFFFCRLVDKVMLITSVNLLLARQTTKWWTVFVLINEIFNITAIVIPDFDVSIVVFYLYY